MWTLFIYNLSNRPFPKYIVVFIDKDSAQAKIEFNKRLNIDPDDKGYESFTGTTKENAWQEALDKGVIQGTFTLDDILKMPEVIVFGKNNISEDMVCSQCGEEYPYANGPNQDDGSFKCFGCRSGY